MTPTNLNDVLDLWSGGQLLAFSAIDGQTDFDEGIVARTAFDAPGLEVKLPAPIELRFRVDSMDDLQDVTLTGDTFSFTAGDQNFRGAIVDAHHLLIEGPLNVEMCDDSMMTLQSEDRTLIAPKDTFDDEHFHTDLEALIGQRRQWILQKTNPGLDISAERRRTYYKAVSTMKTQVYSPQGPIPCRWTTPDRWPHQNMWLWDSAFHAIGWRHLDIKIAREAIEAVISRQCEDGMIAHMANPHKQSEITQPPVLAFAAMILHRTEPDISWLERIYSSLCDYLQWDFRHRDTDANGLLEWFIEGDPNCRSGESGMDNSPRFDSAMQLDAPDFNAFAALECENLSAIAELLGKTKDAQRWSRKHADLCRLINERLWNEETGMYMDCDVVSGKQTDVLSSAGFLPLLCGAPDAKQVERLVENLRDPQRFASALPIPSIAICDTAHYSKDMWRGPAWVNINWLISLGLRRYGINDLADEIRDKTLEEIQRQYLRYGSIFEFYDDRKELDPPKLLRKKKNAPEVSPMHQVFFDYGWSNTFYVDWVLDPNTTAARVNMHG